MNNSTQEYCLTDAAITIPCEHEIQLSNTELTTENQRTDSEARVATELDSISLSNTADSTVFLAVLDKDSNSIESKLEALADKINQSLKKTAEEIIGIGIFLIEARRLLSEDKKWGMWINQNFAFSDSTARKYISIAKAFEHRSPGNATDFSKLYTLSTIPNDKLSIFLDTLHMIPKSNVQKLADQMTKRELEDAVRIFNGDGKERKERKISNNPYSNNSVPEPLPLISSHEIRTQQDLNSRVEDLRVFMDDIVKYLAILTDLKIYHERAEPLRNLLEKTLDKLLPRD